MKTIIAGSRSITDYKLVYDIIKNSNINITEIVCGGAKGIDSLGEKYALENNIPIKYFFPDWNLGKRAGILRNEQMGDYAEALIAIWDGNSKGTKHMINYASKKNLVVFVKDFSSPINLEEFF